MREVSSVAQRHDTREVSSVARDKADDHANTMEVSSVARQNDTMEVSSVARDKDDEEHNHTMEVSSVAQGLRPKGKGELSRSRLSRVHTSSRGASDVKQPPEHPGNDCASWPSGAFRARREQIRAVTHPLAGQPARPVAGRFRSR